MKWIAFNDERIDSFLLMEMTDLAKTLCDNADVKVDFKKFTYFDFQSNTVSISHFWKHREAHIERLGLKSDIFLTTLGTLKYSDIPTIKQFIADIQDVAALKKLAQQLFVLLENQRLIELVQQQRRGTKKAFNVRRQTYLEFFQSQREVYRTKTTWTDLVLIEIAISILTNNLYDVPVFNEQLDEVMPLVYQRLHRLYDHRTTQDTVDLTFNIIYLLMSSLTEDMLNDYFYLPQLAYEQVAPNWTMSDLLRQDSKTVVQGNDKDKLSSAQDEQVSIRQRQSNKTDGAYMQADVQQGSNAMINADQAHEGDESDDVTSYIEGKGKGAQHQQEDDINTGSQTGSGKLKYGFANRYAYTIWDDIDISKVDRVAYLQDVKETQGYSNKLVKMINKTLQHKEQDRYHHLPKGRLQKQLVPLFTDEFPKVFYKKKNKSQEIDATFLLLVDNSASMSDKMEETKKGITLFHESLKSLMIRHEIIGFYEDAFEVKATSQPNHFLKVVPYQQSLSQHAGNAITLLQPMEDNRDGYALRIATEQLLKRPEQQKFLLIFSDGEPAAFDYEANGILDTYEAVIEAQRRSIYVLNIYLSQTEITEAEQQTMTNIYGNHAIFIEGVENLPAVLVPILKKLILSSIQRD